MILPNTNEKLTKNPMIGIQVGKTLTLSGCGSRFLIRHSARFTNEKIVSIITEVVSASEARRPMSASIRTRRVTKEVAIRGVCVR